MAMFLKIGCLEITLLREWRDRDLLRTGDWDILKLRWRNEW